MQNSQAKSQKQITKVFWRAGKVKKQPSSVDPPVPMKNTKNRYVVRAKKVNELKTSKFLAKISQCPSK